MNNEKEPVASILKSFDIRNTEWQIGKTKVGSSTIVTF